MNDEPMYKTVTDDFGELTYHKNHQGRWAKHSRTINETTFMLNADRKTVDYLLALKAGGINTRLNNMSDRIEVWGELEDLPDDPAPITDILNANIINWLLDVGLIGRERMNDALSNQAYRSQYHPILKYLYGLEWDGQDHFSALVNHFEFGRSAQGIGPIFMRRWMVGAIAKIVEKSQNFMLVIDGTQGIGKSFLAQWLCPLKDFFIEGAIHPEDKDAYKRLMSYWIWEVGELEGTTRKSDRAALKDFISRREVTIRLPYGKYDITKPAAASLIGTINEDGAGFLKDTTGSRRFAVIHMEHIDFDYSKIDCNQLWAQAYQWYKSGEPWELQPTERMAQASINEEYEAESAVEQYFRKYYTLDLVAHGQNKDFVPSVDILDKLKFQGLGGNDRANIMEISAILKREGLTKKRQGGLHGFCGIQERSQVSIANLANLGGN